MFALLCLAAATCRAAPEAPAGAAAAASKRPDPYKDLYRDYRPPFLGHLGGKGWGRSAKEMKLSSEPAFFTRCYIDRSDRPDALIKAAGEREEKKLYLEALKIYQMVIDEYPQKMYRVSDYGVFVPAAQYCQRRILNLPPETLKHYRTKYDARAQEAFTRARDSNSLLGLSEVSDLMLATSYGGKALIELGNAALDNGHYLAALERYQTIYDFFPAPELRTPELALKVAYCRKMLQQKAPPSGSKGVPSELSRERLGVFRRVVDAARPEVKPFHSQFTSGAHVDADDYTLYPPTTDPMARRDPVWAFTPPGARGGFYVHTVPTVTGNSVIYRYKNIVYCHSILNGELRWKSALGGRAGWQWGINYNHEDVLIHDGLVFTAMRKGGPSLVALDEVTGRLRWAYGPLAASTPEEARMRFENAPAAGPRAVFAGYILDNIEGDTHIDTEYGIMGFESTTGRVLWRTPLCRLSPGKFAAGYAVRYRNRIRSFASPPTYHQGTVYYCTNSGAIVALDALSGHVKWLFRYPYYHNHPHSIHDATRGFGGVPSSRSGYASRLAGARLWYNQRPLVYGENVYFTPVDSPFLMCVNRRDGRIGWTHYKAGSDIGYFMGPNRKGELVIVYSTRRDTRVPSVFLLDPKTGKYLNFKYDQRSRRSHATSMVDIIRTETHPILVNLSPGDINFQLRHGMKPIEDLGMNLAHFTLGARPFMTEDDQLYIPSFVHLGYPYYGDRQHLAHIDLKERRVVEQTDYYSESLRARAFEWLYDRGHRYHMPTQLEAYKKVPHKDKGMKIRIEWLEKCVADEIPPNKHTPFRSFSRVTFVRHGVPFELRFGTREVEMLYDRAAVEGVLAKRIGPQADFARAELAVADGRLDDAARLLQECLNTVSTEDLDFRSVINQLLYRVHKRLARSAICALRADIELDNAIGMTRTVTTLGDEMESLFAVADAYARRNDHARTARCLQVLIGTYGHHEYPVAPIAAGRTAESRKVAEKILGTTARYANNPFHGSELTESIGLTRKGLGLYFSTVSPLARELTVGTAELAADRLVRLQAEVPEFARAFETQAKTTLDGGTPEEQLHWLRRFPGTRAAQAALDRQFARVDKLDGPAARARLRRLADAARVAHLDVPAAHRSGISAPLASPSAGPIRLPLKMHEQDLAEEEKVLWLVLERCGDRYVQPHLAFLGGRVRKRFDNKFVLACYDLNTGRQAWRRENMRLKGSGEEPGFFRAYVRGDVVLVHGLSDVLAFDLKTGELRWRFRTPFNFEIDHAVMSGDLLVLAGETETLALYIPTKSPVGEVVWQVREEGDVYTAPYLAGDRLVSVRQLPFNVTVRYRATGSLVGRLELPDLSRHTKHPLVDEGHEALPVAHDGRTLVVTDGRYYIAIDTDRLRIAWKRLIDQNDPSTFPAIRFTLRDKWLLVLKKDYDQNALWMLDSRTGKVLWHTDPKQRGRAQPLYAGIIRNDKVYGLMPHPGQGYYFAALDCKTGKRVFRHTVEGYTSVPVLRLSPRFLADHLVLDLQDRQDFEIHVLDAKEGKLVAKRQKKGSGAFGVHGRVSATAQDGRIVFLAGQELELPGANGTP